MEMTLNITADERHACRRAAVFIRGIAAGLVDSSSKDSLACAGYAATLEAVAAAQDTFATTSRQKIDIEQSAFLLEGVRNGLDNADRDTAANLVQRDIERLNDLVLRYNSHAGQRL